MQQFKNNLPISSTLLVPDFDQLPRHIAIIMDGNGRWAQKKKTTSDLRPRQRRIGTNTTTDREDTRGTIPRIGALHFDPSWYPPWPTWGAYELTPSQGLVILRSQDVRIRTTSGLFRSRGLKEIPLVTLLVLSASTLRS